MSENEQDRGQGVPSWQVPQERQPDTDAYHIWTSRPLLRSVYWKPVPAPPHDLVSSSYEIFVDQRAWLAMHEHVWETPTTQVPFGYLVGDLCEDPTANRRFVIVTRAVRARFEFDEIGSEQISREAGVALRLEVDRHRGILVGWYHRHLDGPVELSQQDLATHRERFTEPWQCAFLFVGDGSHSKGGCFRSTPSGISSDLPFPFYEMASNESLLPRGVKRSYLDWENYTTVDEVQSEPPARPELVEPAPVDPVPDVESLPTQSFDVESDTEAVAEPEAEVEVEPEVEPEVEVEAEPEVDVEPVAEVEIEPEVELEPEAEPEPEVEAEPEVDVEPVAEVEIEPEVEPEVEPEPEVEAEPEVDVEPAAEGGSAIDWDLDASREDVELPESISDEANLLDDGFEMDLIEAEAVDVRDEDAAEEVIDDIPDDVTDTETGPAVESMPGEEEHADLFVEEPAPHPETMPASDVLQAAGPGAESESPVRVPSRRFRNLVVGFEGETDRKRRMLALGIGGLVVAAAVIFGLVSFVGDSGPESAGVRNASTDGTQTQAGSDLQNGAPGGAPGDSAVAGPVSREQLEQQSQEMLSTISRFYGSVVAMDDGTATCENLQVAFVIVEDAWIEYNSRYKAGYPGELPADLAARDERLYLGVQDVEREFERSGCPRP